MLAAGAMLASGCAETLERPARALEANPHEAEVDALWRDGDMAGALPLAQEAAAQGYPWAQLRMGMFASQGDGIQKNDAAAVIWYRKAAAQFAEPDGMGLDLMVGLSDRHGFFRQWDDALAARFLLARHYYEGAGVGYDITRAYLLADNVRKLSEGRTIEACDMDYRTLYRKVHHPQCAITPEEVRTLLHGIEAHMTEQDRALAAEQAAGWEYTPLP